MDVDLDARPTARLGYAVDDLQAYVDVAEQRIVELEAAIAAARVRLDEADRRISAALELRRRIAQQFLDGSGDGSAAAAQAATKA